MANWNFDDFLRRLEAIKGMGSLDELMKQVPGLGAILNDVDFHIEDLEPIERILRAMTREERVEPGLLEGDPGLTRRERIALESGTSVDAVDSLIVQFKTLCQMLETMSPDEVTQELIEQHKPSLEEWQTSPDAWKEAGEEPVEPTGPRETREAFGLRVDAVLRKINATGMASLTPRERGLLDEASRRFRAAR